MEINPFESVPSEILYEICEKLDFWDLLEFSDAYLPVKYICRSLIKKKTEKYKGELKNFLWNGHDIWANKEIDSIQVEVQLDPLISYRLRHKDRVIVRQTLSKEGGIYQEDIESVEWISKYPPKQERYENENTYIRSITIDLNNKDIEEILNFLINDYYYIQVSETGFIL